MIDFDDPLYSYCPYPGMRPFDAADARYFCGRDRHVKGVINRLKSHCFVAVAGGSGSGKSSLVRAGVIPHLETNGLERPGQVWVIAICRPGKRPLESLRDALLKTLASSALEDFNLERTLLDELEGWPDISSFLDLYRDRLDVEHEHGEADLSENCQFSRDEIATRRQRANLLLLVDQFEEIFDDTVVMEDGTRRLVELISPISEVEVKTRLDKRVFTIVTMRSENLRSLGAFPILPDLFTETQYHLGPLTASEIRDAIQMPALKFIPQMRRIELTQSTLPRKIEVEAGLVECMVVGALALQHDPDHLFLVQHASRAVWLQAAQRWRYDNVEEADLALAATDFAALSHLPKEALRNPGTHDASCAAALKEALNSAAEAQYQSLGTRSRLTESDERRLARRLFTLLAIKDDNNWPTRRETTRAEVLAVARDEDQSLARDDALEKVVAAFRDPHPFIREEHEPGAPPAGRKLYVAHEALIRNWSRFGAWLDEEHQARLDLKEITKSCREWQNARSSGPRWKWWRGSGELLSRKKLEQHRAWKQYRENRSWHEAQLGHDGLNLTATPAISAANLQRDLDDFWRQSENHDNYRRWGPPAALTLLALLILAFVGFIGLQFNAIDIVRIQSIAAEISLVASDISDYTVRGENPDDDKLRLHEAATALYASDQLRRELDEASGTGMGIFMMGFLKIVTPSEIDDLKRSVAGAERLTLAALRDSLDRRVDWDRTLPEAKPPSRTLRRLQSQCPGGIASGNLLAGKDIVVLNRVITIVAVKQEPRPNASNAVAGRETMQPSIVFGAVSEAGCDLGADSKGFQLLPLEGVDVRIDDDMHVAAVSGFLANSGILSNRKPVFRFYRLRWIPICGEDGEGRCADPQIEMWPELLQDPLLPRDDVEGVPRLAEAHLVKWSPEDVEATPLGCDEKGECIIRFGEETIRVQSVGTPKPGLHQHRVQVLRQVGDRTDPMIEDHIETITLEFQGPEVDGVQYDPSNPQKLVFRLGRGLGSASVTIGRDDLLRAACREGAGGDEGSEGAGSGEGHLPTFNDFTKRRDDWMNDTKLCS